VQTHALRRRFHHAVTSMMSALVQDLFRATLSLFLPSTDTVGLFNEGASKCVLESVFEF
jgi:hypothetical protein